MAGLGHDGCLTETGGLGYLVSLFAINILFLRSEWWPMRCCFSIRNIVSL